MRQYGVVASGRGLIKCKWKYFQKLIINFRQRILFPFSNPPTPPHPPDGECLSDLPFTELALRTFYNYTIHHKLQYCIYIKNMYIYVLSPYSFVDCIIKLFITIKLYRFLECASKTFVITPKIWENICNFKKSLYIKIFSVLKCPLFNNYALYAIISYFIRYLNIVYCML